MYCIMAYDTETEPAGRKGICSVVIPAFNEEQALQNTLPEVIAFCEKLNWPLIIVDDGSTDGTGKVINSLSSGLLTRITHKVNRGYGGALKSGIKAAETEYVVTVDADGQHRLDDLLALLDELQRVDADMVIGSREDALHKGSRSRRIGKALIRWVAHLLMPLPVYDLNSGLKMYRTELVKKYIKLCPDSMAFSDIITLVFISERCRVVEHPIEIGPRLGGVSTIGVQTAMDTLMEIVNIVVLFNPMRIFFPLALALGVFGFIWGIPFVLRGEGVQTGALLGITSGLLFFLLGLLAEQISFLRRNSIK